MPEERALGQVHPLGNRAGGDFTRVLLGGQFDHRRHGDRFALVRRKMFGPKVCRVAAQSK